VVSGRGLCDELITRPEESYQLWCVVVCDLENLKNDEGMTRVGSQRHGKKNVTSVSDKPVSQAVKFPALYVTTNTTTLFTGARNLLPCRPTSVQSISSIQF